MYIVDFIYNKVCAGTKKPPFSGGCQTRRRGYIVRHLPNDTKLKE
ncbi:hypothetical protein HMPREF9123_1106 [Neisseria bacilliformis ATCC BAA-1200]|uniref:Uncharacterized protein n=1 Tax=Neisseria bacilliformis ATCC BAA-1200 TaxID=888742 RepID=F2BBK1_9NEIS|nr:hypothetical protein HMPREF9123_1106 [Neisseria bacilliformis ATCC BAA-1200]